MVQLGIQKVRGRIPKFRTRSGRVDSNQSTHEVPSVLKRNVRSDRTLYPSRARSRFVHFIGLGLGSRGFSTLGGCLALLSAGAGLGLYKIIERVQNLTETQIALDHCSGQFAIRARAAAQTMENSLNRVVKERFIARVACSIPPFVLCPTATEILTVALTAETILEKAVHVFWIEQASLWSSGARCEVGYAWVKRSNFPKFPFPIVDPELGIAGMEAENYLVDDPLEFQFRVQKQKLASSALAYRDSKKTWQVKWTE